MKRISLYENNKPLFNSTLTGLLYFIFCWSLDFGDETKYLFTRLMLFLPGLTFPLATSYYNTEKVTDVNRIVHFISSIAVYHGAVWIFSAEGSLNFIVIVAGFSGSLLFLLLSKYLLKKEISVIKVLITSTLSGLAFLPYKNFDQSGTSLGLTILLWTIINGLLLNNEYRRSIFFKSSTKSLQH